MCEQNTKHCYYEVECISNTVSQARIILLEGYVQKNSSNISNQELPDQLTS